MELNRNGNGKKALQWIEPEFQWIETFKQFLNGLNYNFEKEN